VSHACPTRFCYRGERGECESKRERSPAGDRARESIDRDSSVDASWQIALVVIERLHAVATTRRIESGGAKLAASVSSKVVALAMREVVSRRA